MPQELEAGMAFRAASVSREGLGAWCPHRGSSDTVHLQVKAVSEETELRALSSRISGSLRGAGRSGGKQHPRVHHRGIWIGTCTDLRVHLI